MTSHCTGILCNAPSYIPWVIAVLAISSLFITGQLFSRLEIYHNLLWRELGSPGFGLKIGVSNNLISPLLVMRFLWVERISKYGDPTLTKIVWELRIIGTIAVTTLVCGVTVSL
jgi:hypothetical protein